MILSVKLQSLKIKNKVEHYHIFINANEVSRVNQNFERTVFERFISDQITQHLPTHYYQWEQLDWELRDHRDIVEPILSHAAQAALTAKFKRTPHRQNAVS